MVTDPQKTYLAVAATYDNGGAKSVRIYGMWLHYCKADNQVATVVEEEPKTTETAPAAAVGDSVSNGLWTYYVVKFAAAPQPHWPCPGGHGPHHIGFRWYTDSFDFHDNESWSQGEIFYFPHGA